MHIVTAHADCDGIIAAYLYIKHMLKSEYPNNIKIVLTQPWRSSKDLSKAILECKDIDSIVILDLALDKDMIDTVNKLAKRGIKITIIDHHLSSKNYISDVSKLSNINAIWSKAPSTPRLMVSSMKFVLNPHEEMLVNIADVCEGGSGGSDVKNLADMLKLALSRDPSDLIFMRKIIDDLLKSKNIFRSEEIINRAKISKWVLNTLINRIINKSIKIGNMLIHCLTLAESRIYAGLIGVASTEVAKKENLDIVIIREEENKVVVTVRSMGGNALHISELIARKFNGKHGGHNEAASATLPKINIEGIVKYLKDLPLKISKMKNQN